MVARGIYKFAAVATRGVGEQRKWKKSNCACSRWRQGAGTGRALAAGRWRKGADHVACVLLLLLLLALLALEVVARRLAAAAARATNTNCDQHRGMASRGQLGK